jgi:hypothetical protein
METWYRTNAWSTEIKPVQVVSETAAFVTILGDCGKRREAKSSRLHKTRDEARKHLIAFFEKKEASLKEQLAVVNENLAELRAQG